MLATSGSLPADDSSWAYEIKWDGVRVLTSVWGGAVSMESRNLLDITMRYPELHGLAEAVPDGTVLDGEVVAFADDGRPSFQRLQSRMHVGNARQIAELQKTVPVHYVVFDVLHLAGESMLEVPYESRRERVDVLELASKSPCWLSSAAHIGDGPALLDASRTQGLEGIVAKKLGSLYTPGKRSKSWLKIKNQRRQEVVIGGWLPGSGNRSGRIGALLVGVNDESGLRYSGRVGTGFSDKTLATLEGLLALREVDESPFADHVPQREARFVRPELVCDVEFTEWTDAGTLRHPSYKGLRDDKPPEDVTREP